jgi:hemerythrin
MGLLVWSEKYSVNVREIDDQHQKLIGMVGRLNDAMSEGKDTEALGKILGDLLEYTRTHFADEERLMQAAGYPDFETHKAKHTWLTDRVAELYKGYQDGRVTISREVMMFLQNWVDSHIMGTDKDYAPFLDGKGISQPIE